MGNSFLQKGKSGEKLVGKYLEKRGYKIVCYNYHSRYGEIDIICKNSKYTIFVEVKTRKSFKYQRGIEAVTKSKREKIIKTSLVYISENEIYDQLRFDVAEVLMKSKNDFEIIYYENAFDMEEFNAFF